MTQALTESVAVADAGFWPAVADAVLRLVGPDEGSAPRDLRRADVILPSWSHAQPLRTALQAGLRAEGSRAFIPPRMYTLAAWAGEVADGAIERRVELFEVLRGNEWVRTAFGPQPAALWALATNIEAVCDELTFAAVDGSEALEARIEASLARHFHRRALRTMLPQAQLILQLWRASMARDHGAMARLAVFDARIRGATRPLLFVAAGMPPGWMRGRLVALAERVPVHLLVADAGAAVAARPLLAAAWPELIGGDAAPAPIVERARSVTKAEAAQAPGLLEAGSLEDESIAVCEQVVKWLRPEGQGDLFSERVPRSIALVALDRVAARRVRALLERAAILVRDETGWKLSTTSAAGAVMRLFELGANGFHHRDLLDWLKSPFTLQGFAGKAFLVETIDKVIRSRGIVQGLGPIVLALHEAAAARPEQPHERAIEWLQSLETHANRLSGATSTIAGFAQALQGALSGLGMRAALAADPVGADVLEILDDLQARAVASAAIGRIRFAPAEFRAMVAARFEEETIAAGAIDSPISMVSLSATTLRDFDAAVLVGADAAHLPAPHVESFFFSNAVRADLGLPGRREATREQAESLAALLVRVPRVMAVWCSRRDDEPRAISPWLARLRAVARAAGHDPLRAAQLPQRRVEPAPTGRPAPRAPQRLLPEISATQYQSLVECPYQFYARHLLRLRKLDEVTDEPSPSEYGKAVHEVLAEFHLEWRDRDLRGASDEELATSLMHHADRVFDPLVERRPRMLGLRRQFGETQLAYLVWLRRRLGEGWSFEGAEVDLRSRFEVDAAGVQAVELKGRIDRIDVRGDEVEVLDYKARRKQQLSEDLALAGENVQLPFYGLLYPGRVKRAAFVFLQRTSDRQDQVGTLAPRQEYPKLVEALRVRLRGDLARIAGGERLPALGNEVVCEWCEMRGLCRRDFWHESGEPR
ncbi:MAG TPA: PD-(D/E)XK nuclease family protein [Burkholderiaceae bacterium]|nr:PD-(D/E)XK nuclease family protein [Burkholderiaceae bacterium]